MKKILKLYLLIFFYQVSTFNGKKNLLKTVMGQHINPLAINFHIIFFNIKLQNKLTT